MESIASYENNQYLGFHVKGKSSNVSFMRFIAALFVIYSHSFVLSTGSDAGELFMYITRLNYKFSHIALTIFFLFGGFYITKSFIDSKSIFKYFKSRILRIFPPLIMLVLITVFVVGPIFTTLELKDYFSHPDTYKYLKNILLTFTDGLPGVFTNLKIHSINGALWTLIFEFNCYIFVAILGVLGILKKKEITLGISCFIWFIYIFRNNIFASDFVFLNMGFFNLLWFLSIFSIGMVFYLFKDSIKIDGKIAIACFLIVCICFCIGVYDEAVTFFGAYPLIYLAYSPKIKMPKLKHIGDISYGIYLYGFLIQVMIISLFGGTMHPYLNLLLTYIIVIPVAYLSSISVERVTKLKNVNITSNVCKLLHINYDYFKDKYDFIVNNYYYFLDKFFIYIESGVLALFLIILLIVSIIKRPKTVIDINNPNEPAFVEGFYEKSPDEGYRWISGTGVVNVRIPKKATKMYIDGLVPESFTNITSVTVYINNDFQVKYDLSTNKSFNICFDLSAFSSEYFAMNVDVKIIFNDVHRPTSDEADQRYLSGIIWRFEIE